MNVVLQRHGRIARITFDRAERANVLDRETVDQLIAALTEAAGDRATRVVTLRGAGDKVFCGGYDLDAVERTAGDTGLDRLMAALAQLPLPTVAAVGGHALGAGFELACRCDLRVVRAGVRVGLPAVRLGVAYRAEGLARILAVAPMARTLLLTGQQVQAAELPGFADVVAPPATFETEVDALAGMVAEGAPAALAYTTRALRSLAAPSPQPPSLLESLAGERAEVLAGGDLGEALDARREGRAPDFRPRPEGDDR